MNSIYTVHILCACTVYVFKNIKNGSTQLFTHLKIILLQCFQFSISAKISCIQTDPSVGLDPCFQTHVCVFRPFFFFSTWTVTSYEFTVQETKNTIHALFTDPTTLFTHLKIILIQYFQFSVSVKISCIQIDPSVGLDLRFQTHVYIFRHFFFLAREQ